MKKPMSTNQVIAKHLNSLSPSVFAQIVVEIESSTRSFVCHHCSKLIWFSGDSPNDIPDTFECPTCEGVNEIGE